MGWLFGHPTKESLVRHLDGQFSTAPSIKLVKRQVVGSCYWAVCEYIVDTQGAPKKGDRIVLLCLLQGRKDSTNYAWGYKDMDECMGPYRVNCPIGLLNQAGPDDAPHLNENARKWRAKVREGAARKAKAPKPEAGLTICVGQSG